MNDPKTDRRFRWLTAAVVLLFLAQIPEWVAGRFGLAGSRLAARVVNLEQQVEALEREVERLRPHPAAGSD